MQPERDNQSTPIEGAPQTTVDAEGHQLIFDEVTQQWKYADPVYQQQYEQQFTAQQPQVQQAQDEWSMPGQIPDFMNTTYDTGAQSGGVFSNPLVKKGALALGALVLLIGIGAGIGSLFGGSGDDQISSNITNDTVIESAPDFTGSVDEIKEVKQPTISEECPSGYKKITVAGEYKCEKTAGSLVSVPAPRTCPSGYTKTGSGSSVQCVKYTGGKTTTVNAAKKETCPAGTTNKGSSCLKVETGAKPAQKASCTAGFVLRNGMCERDFEAKEGTLSVRCANGQKLSGGGASAKCIEEKAKVAGKKGQYKCPAGYTMITGNKCQKKTTEKSIKQSYCATSGDTIVKKGGKDVCAKVAKNATVTAKTGCPSGYPVLATNKTTCVQQQKATKKTTTTYSCPSGYKASGTLTKSTNCTKVVTANATKTSVCNTGVMNSKKTGCVVSAKVVKTPVYIWTTNYVYKCPSGYTPAITIGTLNAFSKCKKFGQLAQKNTVKSCPPGYSFMYHGSSQSCGKLSSHKNSCPAGYALSGPSNSPVGAYVGTPSCAKTTSTSVKYVCPSGYKAVSTTGCSKTASKASVAKTNVSYYCPTTHSKVGSAAFNANTICQKKTTKAAVYVCPSGYTKTSGTQKATVCQSNATRAVSLKDVCKNAKAKLTSNKANCERIVDTKNATKDADGKPTCPSGYTENSKTTKCEKTHSPTGFSCSDKAVVKGTGSARHCVKMKVERKASQTRPTCASGYKITNGACKKETTVAKKVEYTCATGTKTSANKCVSNTGGKKETTAPVVGSCPAGQEKSGDTCKKQDVAVINTETVYQCGDGWFKRATSAGAVECVKA